MYLSHISFRSHRIYIHFYLKYTKGFSEGSVLGELGW